MVSYKKIKEIFNFEKGELQSTKNTPGDYDFITAAEDWKTHENYTHECEALIFAHGASGSLGRTHYVDGKFIASDLTYVITPKKKYKDKIDLYFYYIYFNSIKEIVINEIATGTSKLAINQTNFGNYEVKLPDLKEQKKINKIIKKVDSLIKIYDDNLVEAYKLKKSIIYDNINHN